MEIETIETEDLILRTITKDNVAEVTRMYEYPNAILLEKARVNKYPNYPSRMACLYVSKTLKEAETWFEYFVDLGRPTFQIVKLKIKGNVFYGDAEKCFDGRLTEKENLFLAEKYWENKDFDKSSILEMLVDGDIEVIEIVKEL